MRVQPSDIAGNFAKAATGQVAAFAVKLQALENVLDANHCAELVSTCRGGCACGGAVD